MFFFLWSKKSYFHKTSKLQLAPNHSTTLFTNDHTHLLGLTATMRHTSHSTPLIVSSGLFPCPVRQSVCPPKLLNITTHRSQRNLWAEFQSSVIPQPSCSSWLGTILGMPPPAVLHTSRSCSCKFQQAQAGFDAQRAWERLCVYACICVVCASLRERWQATSAGIDLQPFQLEPKGQTVSSVSHWEGHYNHTDPRSLIPLRDSEGERKIRGWKRLIMREDSGMRPKPKIWRMKDKIVCLCQHVFRLFVLLWDCQSCSPLSIHSSKVFFD